MPKGKRRKSCLKGKKPKKRQHKNWWKEMNIPSERHKPLKGNLYSLFMYSIVWSRSNPLFFSVGKNNFPIFGYFWHLFPPTDNYLNISRLLRIVKDGLMLPQKLQIIVLLNQGYKPIRIARITSISLSTVYRWKSAWKQANDQVISLRERGLLKWVIYVL